MKKKLKNNKVAIVMGSQSDYSTMQYCEKVLKILKVKFETKVVSAHRTPDRMYKFAKSAENKILIFFLFTLVIEETYDISLKIFKYLFFIF